MANLPRKLPADISFDEADDEIIFTRAALLADPDAKDLITETDDWMGYVDKARSIERDARIAKAEADAERSVANDRFDDACILFSDDLYLDVGKDRSVARWLMFFSVPVHRFVRQALDKQMGKVGGWLSGSQDPVLEKHRGHLDAWLKACDTAVGKQRSAAVMAGTAKLTREEMADALTRERDGLFELLSARARERKLPRDWPSRFFKVIRAKDEREETPPGEGANQGSPG